ncbi:MAG TPA: YdiU family protein, partial [Gemmatimonadales bacterium]
MPPITSLSFDNTYAHLPPELYEVVDPTPLPDPVLVALNPDAAQLIELDPAVSTATDLASYLSGARRLPGAEPLAMLYAGHQFGVWVPQLGDGRAFLLGEVCNRRGGKWDLHLKGGGPTRFARGGDGRSVLRSVIREYLGSEAMHGLGIPTTRALAIVASEALVRREQPERAATLLRLAPSHVRFGTFEALAALGRNDLVGILADYVISHHYPGFEQRYGAWLREITVRTARLIASWQAAGFAHGVMNTDNMSLVGLTLDYGPFGFMEEFDPGFIPNHTDHDGRYAFDQQPGVALWNLHRLAESLAGRLIQAEAEEALSAFHPAFEHHLGMRLRARLGLAESRPEDVRLVTELYHLLRTHRVDHTRFFRALGTFSTQSGAVTPELAAECSDRAELESWLALYRDRLAAERSRDQERQARMARVNPVYILRNWLAERAIRKAVDERDYSEIERLRVLLKLPFQHHPGFDEYSQSA